ncbi:hypothetical protein SAMN05192574_102299 [Mucilaginibacter gossypiicola]|uniref:Uncharacterized protein n=2 Tax=Mucilaginibacter gossypiicola TaxID=551995 RepID=A0A1H8DER8_9SPHI|nr:hypothetical protein SAMN05192574_102299 [Mucilaginibacter gossypiicola]
MPGFAGSHGFGLYALMTMLPICVVIWIITRDKNTSDKD